MRRHIGGHAKACPVLSLDNIPLPADYPDRVEYAGPYTGADQGEASVLRRFIGLKEVLPRDRGDQQHDYAHRNDILPAVFIYKLSSAPAQAHPDLPDKR